MIIAKPAYLPITKNANTNSFNIDMPASMQQSY